MSQVRTRACMKSQERRDGPVIVLKPQYPVGVYSIETQLLHAIGLDFVRQPNASALLWHINDNAPFAFAPISDVIQSMVQLLFAIAFQRTNHLISSTRTSMARIRTAVWFY